MKIYPEDTVVYASVEDTNTLYNLDFVLIRTGKVGINFAVSGAPSTRYNEVSPIDYPQVYSLGKVQVLPRIKGEIPHPQMIMNLRPYWVQFNDTFKHNHSGKIYYVVVMGVAYKKGNRLVYRYELSKEVNGKVAITVNEETLNILFTPVAK